MSYIIFVGLTGFAHGKLHPGGMWQILYFHYFVGFHCMIIIFFFKPGLWNQCSIWKALICFAFECFLQLVNSKVDGFLRCLSRIGNYMVLLLLSYFWGFISPTKKFYFRMCVCVLITEKVVVCLSLSFDFFSTLYSCGISVIRERVWLQQPRCTEFGFPWLFTPVSFSISRFCQIPGKNDLVFVSSGL